MSRVLIIAVSNAEISRFWDQAKPCLALVEAWYSLEQYIGW